MWVKAAGGAACVSAVRGLTLHIVRSEPWDLWPVSWPSRFISCAAPWIWLHAHREVALWSRCLLSGNNCWLFWWKRTIECMKCGHTNDDNDYISLSLSFWRQTATLFGRLNDHTDPKRPNRLDITRYKAAGISSSLSLPLTPRQSLVKPATTPDGWGSAVIYACVKTLQRHFDVQSSSKWNVCWLKSRRRHRHIKGNLFSYTACCSLL